MLRRVLTHRAAVGQRRAPRSATRQWPVAATRHCTTDERSQAPQLLIVHHSRTGFTLQLADSLEQGARAVADEMELPLAKLVTPALRIFWVQTRSYFVRQRTWPR